MQINRENYLELGTEIGKITNCLNSVIKVPDVAQMTR